MDNLINKFNSFYGFNFCKDSYIVSDIFSVTGQYKRKIGVGSYGTVYITINNFAIKKYNTLIDSSILNEIAILSYLKHVNIINLNAIQIGDYEKNTLKFKIAMPLATNTLSHHYTNTIWKRQNVYFQILRGIAHLHKYDIWHRDIKPQNILIYDKDDIEVKIADFGLAIFNPHKYKNNTKVTTLWWRAPELLLNDETYTRKIDIWSIGKMLLDSILGLTKDVLCEQDEESQLIEIFKLIGTPTDSDCPIFHFSNYNNLFFKNNLKNITAFNSFEYNIVKDSLAYQQSRKNAKELLKYPYFKEQNFIYNIYSVKEKQTTEDKLIYNIKFQKIIMDNITVREYILEIMKWIYEKFRYSFKILNYSIILFDKYISNINIIILENDKELLIQQCYIYSICFMLLSYIIHEDDYEFSEYVYFFCNKLRKYKLKIPIHSNIFINMSEILIKLYHNILTTLNFNLIFKTHYDYILNLTNYKIIEKDVKKKIKLDLYKLVSNYFFVINYSVKDLSLFALYNSNKKRKKPPKIITDFLN